MTDNKKAKQDTSLEVDLLILDHLLVRATRSIIHSRKEATRLDTAQTPQDQASDFARRDCNDLESKLAVFDTFLILFKHNHPDFNACATTSVVSNLPLKLKLHTFANLFFLRHSRSPYLPSPSALAAQRAQNISRAERWQKRRQKLLREIASRLDDQNEDKATTEAMKLRLFEASAEIMGDISIVVPALDPIAARQIASSYDENRRNPESQTSTSTEGDFSLANTSQSPQDPEITTMLLDMIPHFVALNAELCDLHSWELKPRLCETMAELMVHASLEYFSHTKCRPGGLHIVDEAFAWGSTVGGVADGTDHWEQAEQNVVEQMFSPAANNVFSQSTQKQSQAGTEDVEMVDADTESRASCSQIQPGQLDFEISDWTTTRDDYRSLFIPPFPLPAPQSTLSLGSGSSTSPERTPTLSQTTWSSHLLKISYAFPIQRLEATILDFVEIVSKLLGDSMLMSVEKVLDGDVLAIESTGIDDVQWDQIRAVIPTYLD